MKNHKETTLNKKVFYGHLLLTFAIMGVCWGLCIILSTFGITTKSQKWIYAPWFLGGISPAIASYIILKKNKKVSGFRDWMKHIFDFKHNIRSYLLAVALPAIQMILMCSISGYKIGLPLYFLPLMIIAMIFAGGLEEAGWRCITFPELNKKYNFSVSTLITAVIWWLWHLPLFFIPGVSQFQKNFLVFGITVLGLTFILSAVRKLTNSVWLCILCHSIVNSLGNFYHYDMYGSYLASSITTAIIIALSLLLVYVAHDRKSPRH